MRKGRVFVIILSILLMILVIGGTGFVYANNGGFTGKIVIFHAGSLSIPFDELEKAFEARYPGTDVIREAAGSRTTARKVTDLNRRADVVAVADYTVIRALMMPEFTDWYINFATNEMAIMYTSHSRYADEINVDNWYRILLKPGVEYGHSDPNSDPCGYRSQLVWKLAEKYYKEPGLYTKLVKGCPLKNIRPKETDLIALLETGELDYIFIYRSIAQQHNLPFVELPEEISLKNDKYSDFYATVSFDVNGKKPGEMITKIGKPMVYGVTIPNNAPNRRGAIAFLKFLLGPEGRKIMKENGQPPIIPAETNDVSKVPLELRPLVKEGKHN
ncbi:MAG: tungstate ABC transporter substrate-binding protein WtpA [Thermotogae bacterium]|nr:tungstate ABC transporter substrate-binding protein WtpA [Thermotogota bacterium]